MKSYRVFSKVAKPRETEPVIIKIEKDDDVAPIKEVEVQAESMTPIIVEEEIVTSEVSTSEEQVEEAVPNKVAKKNSTSKKSTSGTKTSPKKKDGGK